MVETGTVVTVNVAVVAPATTVTDAGTVALALLLERVTLRPPVGAAPLMVTVPVEELPPTTEVGLRTTPETAGGVMVSVAVFELLPNVAVIVDVVVEATVLVETVNVPVVEPAATVVDAGTVADPELLVRVTVNPPLGAAPVMVTVPVEDVPPRTEAGLSVTDDTVGALTAMVAVLVLER